mgnify:CR=1 FL=1
MKNTFGSSVCLTIFGESHGPAIGAVLDGMAAGVPVDEARVAACMDKRRARGDGLSAARVEADQVQFLSGVVNGHTTGTAIALMIENQNTRSADYAKTADLLRPGHADYTAYAKYHGFQDARGGGHFSGRVTAALVAGGAIVLDALSRAGIDISTHIARCAGISDTPFALDDPAALAAQAEALVGKPEGEKIWTNGECSIIAAAILCVVCDNQKRPEFQNMTNVYWFISEMCRTIGNKMPLLEYVKKLSPSHPARALLSISDVAPSRTRGSFYTSALTTLRLFTSKSIYAITHTSDFTLTDMGSKKQALFVILPDEKTTFYPIASLIVSQQYELLAEAADRRGGRLERRVNFILDEYGNFTPISDMTNKLTVAAGRGMRYALFVQGFDQLKEKYSDNIANTIKGNCQVWAYLQSDDPETLREMSDKLGSYTTSSYQLSASNGKYTTPSNSQSVSLTERKLLNTDEVRRVKRPHQIITSRDHPAMMYAPDLSQWMFNKMLGLGDMEHNRRLREEREQKRPIITDTKQEIALWNIWIYYQKDIMRRLSQQKGAMGGGLDDD